MLGHRATRAGSGRRASSTFRRSQIRKALIGKNREAVTISSGGSRHPPSRLGNLAPESGGRKSRRAHDQESYGGDGPRKRFAAAPAGIIVC